ncbi:hypothetical protein JD79_03601 [Geodermatophilus normandii]|uniref:Peptidase M10 metallopeptidase domain-containing protein n=1 Tax=Geodermatophilus normandii TaxID=1137989 RepID=A0A317QM32_9ACTN|nr:DUF6623 family protein [Geodermatophilus normandii]PWW24422.1 hypothetical protein JD79_03601 [Geodermatophilus normandii]
MITQAVWTHGHTIEVERPDQLASLWRAGFYVRAVGQSHSTNWFHFAVPTPVIVKGKRQMIDSVMLRFRANSAAAKVTNVHVFDGETRIAAFDDLNLSHTGFGFDRFTVPGKPDVLWGIGITVGVRFDGTTASQNTMEFSAVGADLTLVETVRLHVKTLTAPTRFTIDQMVAAMRDVYEPQGFRIVRAGDETLNLPALDVVDVGGCTRGNTTAEQRTLFSNRNGVGANEVVAYFVQATDPPTNGCAAHPAGQPGAVVASGASRWTLGHEIGHVLGLNHVNDNDRLMTGNGTDNITNPPPDLVAAEVTTMRNSPITIDP